MDRPILYSFKRCPYAMRARMALQMANIKCEIREIKLNNKPNHMLAASPKGTVPVLILEDKVIDESNDIINWVLNITNIFKNNLNEEQIHLTEHFIKVFDERFKFHLDRYKYSNRYVDSDAEFHRSECYKILLCLEYIISDDNWIFGSKLGKLDISILPFIRQFRIANMEWFDSQLEIIKVQKLLNNFLDSKLYKKIMHNYDEWDIGSKPVYFPFN